MANREQLGVLRRGARTWKAWGRWVKRFMLPSKSLVKLRLRQALANRNRYLLFLFLFYIITLFGFAGIYYLLYFRDPSSFAFNSDIRASQGKDYNAWAEHEIADQEALIELLRKLLAQLDEKSAPEPTYSFWGSSTTFAASEYQYIFRTESAMIAPGGVVTYHTLTVKDNRDHVVRELTLPEDAFHRFPRNNEDGKKVTKDLISYYESYVSEIRRRLGTLTGSYPEIWSYWDFLYFSAITQTSVGYGDILPNSTRVRVVVVIHLLLSTAMLVLVINLAFPGVRADARPGRRKRLRP